MDSRYLGVPTAESFIRETNPKKGFLKKLVSARGGKISLIDTSLRAWDEVNRRNEGNEVKIKVLGTIIKVCSWWLNQKEQKSGTQTEFRRAAINIVLKRSIGALKGLSPGLAAMESNKSRSIIHGFRVTTRVERGKVVAKGIVAKSLDGNYQLERDWYVQNGKGVRSVAAGAAHLYCETPGRKSFEELVVGDFTTILNDMTREYGGIAPASVAYLPKQERVEFLAIPGSDGRFRRANGNYVLTVELYGAVRLSDMWAMDRYGNLFVRKSGRITGRQAEYFNHSSFCAGNEVIAAGTIMMNDGVLVYIDNNSGHYKPRAESLRESLFVLVENNVNMENVRVGVVAGGGGMENYDAISFMYESTPTAWDHARDAALNLPLDINAGR